MAHILVDTRVCVCWTELGVKNYPETSKDSKIFKSESFSLFICQKNKHIYIQTFNILQKD